MADSRVEEIEKIAASIRHVSYVVPWEAKCLVQAVTGKQLLKKRNVESMLYLGVKKGNGGENLLAHAWLSVGNRGIATTLSSGFDSGTVTAFAARHLQKEGRRLPAYTSVPVNKNINGMDEHVADEWAVSHTHTRLYPNIEHIPVDGREYPPHHALEQIVDEFGDTVFAADNAFWIRAILQKAKQADTGILLTGQLGNAGISWNGSKNHVLYQLLSGRLINGFRSLHNFKKAHQIRWYSAFRYLLLWQLLSPVKHKLQHIKNPGKVVWPEMSPIRREFAEKVELERTFRESSMSGYNQTLASPNRDRIRIMEWNIPITCASWHRYGAFHNMEVRDPSADVHLLEFCFGIPDDLHIKDGKTRLLIKHSMKDILPDEVRLNRHKGRQAADLAHRLLEYSDELSGEIQRISTNPAAQEYLDISALKNSLEKLNREQSYTTNYHHSSRLLTGLMFGYFFEKHG